MSCYQKFYTNQIHSSSLLCQLATMWKSQVLCDASIKSGAVTTKAHRVVLLAACPMLQSMENATVGSHLEVHVASDIKKDSISMFLQYLYEGFMMLTEENCKDVEKIARLLQVDSVIKCCADFYKCLSTKTGNSELNDPYKYTFHDMVEFRHVRSSDLQKMHQDKIKKRSSEFNCPSSPSGKRQRLHKSPSPGNQLSADDTYSMSHSYRGLVQDSSSRSMIPVTRQGISSPSNSLSVAEDRLELVQTDPPDSSGKYKDPKRTSLSVGICSRLYTVDNTQVVSIPDTSNSKSPSKDQDSGSETQRPSLSPTQSSRSVNSQPVFPQLNRYQPSLPHGISQATEDAVEKGLSPSTPLQISSAPVSKRPSSIVTSATENESRSALHSEMPLQDSLQQVQGHLLTQANAQVSQRSQERVRRESSEKSQEGKNKDSGLRNTGHSSSSSRPHSEHPDLDIVKIENEEHEDLEMYIEEAKDAGNQLSVAMDNSSGDHPSVTGKSGHLDDKTCCERTNAWFLEHMKDPQVANKFGVMNPDSMDLSSLPLSQTLPPLRTAHPSTTDSQNPHPSPYCIDLSVTSGNSQSHGSYSQTATYSASNGGPHKLVYISNRKPCMWCQIKRVKTKSGWYCYASYRCEKCDVPLCKQGRDCFLEYHKHIGVPHSEIVKDDSLFPRDKDDSFLMSYAASLQNKTF